MLRSILDAFWGATTGTVCTGAVFAWAERLWPSLPSQRHWRRGVLVDLGYIYVGSVVLLTASAGLGHAIDSLGAIGALGRVQGFVQRLPVIVQVALAIITTDLAGYWKHRLMHTRFFWPFHAVHHSSEDVDWLSNERGHPVEMVVMYLFSAVPLVLLGFPLVAVVWAAQLRRIHSVYEHANLKFAYGRGHYVFVSPVFHRWHHATDPAWANKNYANIFSCFDWAFGTFKLPEEAPQADGFGVSGFPRDLGRQLVQPFRDVLVPAARAPEQPAIES